MNASESWKNPSSDMEMACKKCGEDLPEDSCATYLKRSLCRSCYNEYRKVNMDEEQVCRICADPLTADNIYPNQGRVCRPCYLQMVNTNRKKRRQPPESDTEPILEPPFEVTETFIPERPMHLYIMQNSRIPDEKKLGKSHDPEQRAKDLGKSHNFTMQILKVYNGCGHLEATVHKRLKARKVSEGLGEEWFKIDLQTLDTIVQGVIAESQIQ